MSKEFTRIGIEQLASWILREYDETQQIFGIHKDLFFQPKADDPFTMTRYGQFMESPIGVAAGPHTQMAQNLIAAWLCGSRYLELKTIQTMDDLGKIISKPCIDMQDEGYNCEWSQELKLEDSFDEYLNAWIMLHILRHKFGWTNEKGRGFIFNMSVGYNLEGVLKPNVQEFLDKMANSEKYLKEKLMAVKKYYPQVDEIDIPTKLSDNITLSTMHGCPPDEIEKIAMYLVKERGYHTTIKLNPTLLGPAQLRHILNDICGFETNVPDEAFGHDLKYPDGVEILKNMTKAAAEKGVAFGIKLTNTLESCNHKTIFPEKEKFMYMSGRALHPISINLAAKLQNEFNGQLDITFSAGANCDNMHQILACGIKPVTASSDILKPGGYARQIQTLENVAKAMHAAGASNIDEYIVKYADAGTNDVKEAALINLRRYAGAAPANKAYHKDSKTGDSVKTGRKLPTFDCVKAPCLTTCPVEQDIPDYMYYTSKGDYKKAYEVIMKNNPMPNVLGMICDHQCQHKCTRMNYDSSILIREIKRFIAAKNENRPALQPGQDNGKKVAIIGAGPSGLAAAYFLRLEGFGVDLFETKAFAGGMISDAIPAFRLTDEAIRKDVDFIASLGANIHYNEKIDANRFEEIRKAYNYVYVAVGAQVAKKMGVPGEDAQGVLDQLTFLSDVRRGKDVNLGERVVVIGGGNSAMDAARTALRLGNGTKVTLAYRRTKAEMPADPDEVVALAEEGVEILELHAPVEVVVNDGKVTAMRLQKMKLGEKGADGRRKPVAIEGAIVDVPCTSIISAIGQGVKVDFVDSAILRANPVTGETSLENVFAGGDVSRGAATVVKACGDGRIAAMNIVAKAGQEFGIKPMKVDKGLSAAERMRRSATKVKGLRIPEIPVKDRCGLNKVVIRELTDEEAKAEAGRCLFCNDVCNVCVSVCPNRANRSYTVKTGDYPIYKSKNKMGTIVLEKEGTFRLTQANQVLNIGDFCNECANCTMFCPSAGDPYKQKPKFYLTEESFKAEENGYRISGNVLRERVKGREYSIEERDDCLFFSGNHMEARINKETFAVMDAMPKNGGAQSYSFENAIKMAILYMAVKDQAFNF